MLMKYNQYIKESLLDKLEGPTREEVLKNSSPEILLLLAVQENNFELFHTAIEREPKVNFIDDYFFYALNNKNYDMISQLLDYGFDVGNNVIEDIIELDNLELFIKGYNNFIGDESIIMFYVTKFNRMNLLNYIVNKTSIDINDGNCIGIKTAINNDNYEIVKMLINTGASINKSIYNRAIDKNNSTTELIKTEYNKLVKESLLDKLEGPSQQEIIDNLIKRPKNLLFYSAENNYSDGIKKALNLKKDFASGTIDEAVFYAAQYNSIDALIVLLDYIKINNKKFDYKLHTEYALRIGVRNNSYDVVKYLLNINTDKSSVDINNIDDEMYLILHTKQELKESLLDKLEGPSKEEAWDSIKKSASTDEMFIKSVSNGFLDGVKLALKNGLSNNYYINYGLSQASENNNFEIVKYLVEQGANVNHNHCYAMCFAAQSGYSDIEKYLIEQGADVHAEDEFALMYSMHRNDVEMFNYLIKHGADVNYFIVRGKYKEFIKNNYKVKESILQLLEGPSKEEISKNLGIDIKFDTEEKFINDIIDNMKSSIKTIKHKFVIWELNGVDIMKYNVLDQSLYVDLHLIWKPLINIYGMTYPEVKVFLKNIFEKKFGIGVNPLTHQGTFLTN